MKNLFVVSLLLFSVPAFCMENDQDGFSVPFAQGSGSSHGQRRNPFMRCIESASRVEEDPDNDTNNGFNHYSYNVNFVSQPAPKDPQGWERLIYSWNRGVDQVIAQIPLLIASALINELGNGFPVCSKISSLLSGVGQNTNEDRLTPGFANIQDTDSTIQVLDRLISRLEAEMDPRNTEHQEKLKELKKRKDEYVNTLFDQTLQFEKLLKKPEVAEAA